ncbi:precorrin-2 C(20)-methyltransferase [Marinilabilia salmonicolor]|uniref:precorrin-2 C(20)-methyltransferase n=1 Tax=Marinilabilia salmonicolor TaxID=989 RepID=UPI00029AE0E5|nr:precorrin-2 C(20)-methyltransferase [Marinilabilia salmonicolor]
MKKLTGIGLGPGDPEMVTLKALKALRQADVIYYPATYSKSGSVKSYSLEILQQLDITTECRPLNIPMTDKNRDEIYRKAYQIIKESLEEGKEVAVVNEGDVLFYSTFGYLFKMAKADNMECCVISGIPAFIAAGSLGDIPLVEGNSGFNVIARPKSFAQISQMLQANPDDTLVVMKMKVLTGWYHHLKQCSRPFLYVEKAGTTDGFVTSKVEDLKDREIPYFSVIIFYT